MNISARDCAAIILAGGKASRLGGVSKADVVLGNTTLLEAVSQACIDVGIDRDNIVVVGHANTSLRITLEDPPHSGPAAGIGRGLEFVQTPWVFILSCDIPLIGDGLMTLLDHLRTTDDQEPIDGVRFYHHRPQYLAGLYRTQAVLDRTNQSLTGRPVRSLLGNLNVVEIPGDTQCSDGDTWEDISHLRREWDKRK